MVQATQFGVAGVKVSLADEDVILPVRHALRDAGAPE
jgi:hypothetical protein